MAVRLCTHTCVLAGERQAGNHRASDLKSASTSRHTGKYDLLHNHTWKSVIQGVSESANIFFYVSYFFLPYAKHVTHLPTVFYWCPMEELCERRQLQLKWVEWSPTHEMPSCLFPQASPLAQPWPQRQLQWTFGFKCRHLTLVESLRA